ncbi:hypothetical protein QTP86_016015, partial [Hemibagrus guttatus]
GIQIIVPDREYDSTPLPDYDYNATFDYTFFSNSSTDELERFFKEKESENEDAVLDITDTIPTVSNVSDEDSEEGQRWTNNLSGEPET